jgi:3-hydroxyacyl-CoA dehydrogenase
LARPEKISIIGSGSIGAGWAIVFARVGFEVTLNDIAQASLEQARLFITARLSDLASEGLIADSPDEVAARVNYEVELERAAATSDLVIEAAPEY